MKINIDPVISARIKRAWAALSSDQQRRVAPILANANQQAVAIVQARTAPTTNLSVMHEALLAKSAISDDQDGVIDHLEAGLVLGIQPDGSILGTGKYEQLDPGWLEGTAEWLEHLIVGKVAFNAATPNPIMIPDDVQIAIAGDWGTGDWRTSPSNPAPSTDVRTHMAFLQPHLTIHLGDVYYAGTDDEEQNLLIDLWPAGSLGALTLNSNHEMYSGGTPYFQEALASPKFAIQQRCSFFVLENSNWVIVGLDSAYYADEWEGYNDGLIYSNGGPTTQLNFLTAQVQKNKKVIVLTHHNGLTLDGGTTNGLWQQVTSAFAGGAGGPNYWYWGHIHAAAVYKPFGTSSTLCRCCGHGGLPWGQSSQLASSAQALWYEHRPANDPEIPQRVYNGFAVLHLSGSNIQETFYDENGGVAWQST